jgi:hypothetical protein
MVNVRLEHAWTDPTGAKHPRGAAVEVDAATLAELEAKGTVKPVGADGGDVAVPSHSGASTGKVKMVGPTAGENMVGPTADPSMVGPTADPSMVGPTAEEPAVKPSATVKMVGPTLPHSATK